MSSTLPSCGQMPTPNPLSVPSDLAVAIRVGEKMLARYGVVDSGDIFDHAQAHGGLTEALRILLRAVGAEPEVCDSPEERRNAAQGLGDVPQPYARPRISPSARTRRPPSSSGGYTTTGITEAMPTASPEHAASPSAPIGVFSAALPFGSRIGEPQTISRASGQAVRHVRTTRCLREQSPDLRAPAANVP